MRNLVFISHANPEQNDFVRWLGLQLTREGYLIWSDVTKLIGGEIFWNDIEEAIRKHTIKFIFVLSHASNNPERGTYNELQLGKEVGKSENISDFILPIRVDDIPFGKRNVLIYPLNVIDFHSGWADGLARVLEKLEKDQVPRDPTFLNASFVSSWWKAHFEGSGLIESRPEDIISNWFPIESFPEFLSIHTLAKDQDSLQRGYKTSVYPIYPIRRLVVSFAESQDLGLKIDESFRIKTVDCMQSTLENHLISSREASNALTYLFRTAWLQFMISCGMPLYSMSGDKTCAYFTTKMFTSRTQPFKITEQLLGRRGLVGRSRQKFWHFGVSANVQYEPIPAIIINPHVLFSDDGETIWNSESKLHSSRRTVCKGWWNDKWRDLILASMFWFAGKRADIPMQITLAPRSNLTISLSPVKFASPVTYNESLVTAGVLTDYDPENLDEDSEES